MPPGLASRLPFTDYDRRQSGMSPAGLETERRLDMMSNIKSRAAITVVIAVLALSMTVIGCGTDDEEHAEKYFGRVSKESAPPPTVAAPQTREGETAPTAVASTQPVVVKEQPPKEITYDEAEAAYHQRRYDEAMDLFTLYTERKSENPWGYYMLGLSAWKAGEYATAEEALERALELDPRHVKSWINLGRVLLDDGRPQEALAKIDSALVIDSELDVAHRLRGRVYAQLGRRDEAVEAYRQAIRIDNNDAWSMNNMGLILIEDGRYDEALAPLAHAVELREDFAIFQNNLGMALEHTGHIRAAEDAYTVAVEIDETYAKAYANMERIEGVVEDVGTPPVDLAAIAQRFVEEIEGWSVAETGAAGPEPIEAIEPAPIESDLDATQTDSIVVGKATVGAADSTRGDREPRF